MELYRVPETKSTPEVLLDPEQNWLWIKGQSYPENAFKFYEPLLAWVDRYLAETGQATSVEIELHMPYINTSSTKCLMMLLDRLDEAYLNGRPVKITWRYDPENESELECAEEFKEDLSLPFDIVPRMED